MTVVMRVTVVLLALLLLGCDTEPMAPQLGQSVSQVELPEVDGDMQALAQLRGKTLVLNFWATWCAPCREEMPALQRLSDQLDPQHYQVIGVTVDRDLNLVREFMLKYQISFMQLSDSSMAVASDQLSIQAYPTTLIVGPQGRVDQVVVGPRSWDEPDYYQSLLGMQ